MRHVSKGLLSLILLITLGLIGWATTQVDAGENEYVSSFSVHQCSYCHLLHGGQGPSLTNNADVEILCQTCHGAAGTSPLKAEVHTNTNQRKSDYDPFTFTCTDCHNPHDNMFNWLGGINIGLVGADVDGSGLSRIQTPNSGIREYVFESRGTNVGQPSLHSFADNDEDGNGYYDGACEACHTLAGHHRNNASGDHSHNLGKTCTQCHDHTDYFMR